jgi:PAS domain S-box-containing protein
MLIHDAVRDFREVPIENNLFRRAMDSLYAFVGVLTLDGRILEANSAALRAIGVSIDQIRGKKFSETPWWSHSPDIQKRLEDAIVLAVKGEVQRFDTTHKLADGREIWVDFMLAPVFDEAGNVEFLVPSSADITDRIRREEALKKAEALAESADRAKTLFLANMSHEIRTPLGVVLGFAEQLADPSLGPIEREQAASAVVRNSAQLTRIIDDILDVSKIEFNCLNIELIEFNPLELLEETIIHLQAKAQQKGLKLHSKVEGFLPDRLISDSTRLRQTLVNLIGNAIKFTDKGEVSVICRCHLNDGPLILEYDIQDTGVGLSPEQQDRLFKPFSQGDTSMNRRFGGTGLGLYLSRSLAQAMGGDLELIKSEQSRGSLFRLTIHPRPKIAAINPPEDLGALSYVRMPLTVNQHLARVLIADDSQDNRMLISRILIKAGFEVETAVNGLEAVRMALTNKFDVVLMDLQMPVMNGYEALYELKNRGCLTPILALTAHALKEDREKSLGAGFLEHLVKPINSISLISEIARVIPH